LFSIDLTDNDDQASCRSPRGIWMFFHSVTFSGPVNSVPKWECGEPPELRRVFLVPVARYPAGAPESTQYRSGIIKSLFVFVFAFRM